MNLSITNYKTLWQLFSIGYDDLFHLTGIISHSTKLHCMNRLMMALNIFLTNMLNIIDHIAIQKFWKKIFRCYVLTLNSISIRLLAKCLSFLAFSINNFSVTSYLQHTHMGSQIIISCSSQLNNFNSLAPGHAICVTLLNIRNFQITACYHWLNQIC